MEMIHRMACYRYDQRIKQRIRRFTFNSASPLLQGGEVCQRSTYEQKESIGSNILHTADVQLSLEILGGLPKPAV